MKLKHIEKLCKAAGRILLYDEPLQEQAEEEDGEEPKCRARQWMGDGYAAYPLDGVPYLDTDAVYAIFDVDAKKQDKLPVQHKYELPSGVSFGDQSREDVPLEPVRFQMSIGDDDLALFRDEGGALLVIKADYKKPFDNWKECECFKRMSKDGNAFVAVMSGCILRGLIGTYKISTELVETLGAVYNAAGVAVEGEQMRI